MTWFFNKIFTPFKWMYSKFRDGLRYIFIDNYFKVFLVILPSIFFAIFGLTIVLYGFKNLKDDTTNLTNIGFAILGGLASICFSWSRNLDNKREPLMIERISIAGEQSLHCAIIFLLASALKYSAIHLKVLIPSNWGEIQIALQTIIYIVYTTAFTLAFYKVERVLFGINNLLYDRLHKGIRN